MNMDELMVIYEHIHLLEHLKHASVPSESSVPIETILEMTRSSNSCWSDTVRNEREERG